MPLSRNPEYGQKLYVGIFSRQPLCGWRQTLLRWKKKRFGGTSAQSLLHFVFSLAADRWIETFVDMAEQKKTLEKIRWPVS